MILLLKIIFKPLIILDKMSKRMNRKYKDNDSYQDDDTDWDNTE